MARMQAQLNQEVMTKPFQQRSPRKWIHILKICWLKSLSHPSTQGLIGDLVILVETYFVITGHNIVTADITIDITGGIITDTGYFFASAIK